MLLKTASVNLHLTWKSRLSVTSVVNSTVINSNVTKNKKTAILQVYSYSFI